MRREAVAAYIDQFEYLADCFELIRLRLEAYALRHEALETERVARYSEQHREIARSHVLEGYHDIQRSIARTEEMIARRRRDSEKQGVRFAIDQFVQAQQLGREEYQILLVLLYNESTGRHPGRVTTGNEILNLLFQHPADALRASRFLNPTAPLLSRGLIRALPDDEGTSFMRSNYELTEATLREVVGDRSRLSGDHEQLAADILPEGPYRLVTPRFTLDRVVLDDRIRDQLHDLLWQIREGRRIFDDWEVGRLMEKGRGAVALLAGRPGTGKTMTAEGLAGSLDRRLLVADFSQLESKWIGETEKNIVAIFRAARQSGAVLLIDEADAILAGRLDGGHYNDRAYNRQVSLLLQELEEFDGLCLLTTNRESALDDALARRLSLTIHFGVPGPVERARIWRALVSPRVPLAADVDFSALADRFPLCGGHIKNAVLTALRTAARQGGERARVTQECFIRAAESEQTGFHPEPRPIGFGAGEGYSYS